MARETNDENYQLMAEWMKNTSMIIMSDIDKTLRIGDNNDNN